ncbi:MAG: phosphate/phosphite/phosphonate ABC transporter substrate-binding protein [Burkholderiaceae bacterium]|nr:phosphate/phosphite/phosphonate ABC transporter substrate-binding protein [Burkholderiaceae bacterium]
MALADPPRPLRRLPICGPSRRRLLAASALAGVSLLSGASALAQPAPALRLGIAPYLLPRQLVIAYEPLRAHLSQMLDVPVTIYTAAGFRSFAQALEAGAYDLAFASPHLMRLAAQDWGWRPLARTTAPARIVLVQRAGSEALLPDSLRGGRIAVVESISLAALACADWLAGHDLPPGRAVALDYLSDAAGLLKALARPDTRALAMMTGQYGDLAPEARATAEPRTTIAVLPSPGYIAAPHLTPPQRAAATAALLAFDAGGDHSSLSRSRLIAATPADTAPVERYAQLARDGLSQRGRRNA